MKLIEKKKAVPQVIWGEKYLTKGKTYNQQIPFGTLVIVTNTTVDGDGEVSICSADEDDYIKPEYLQPVTETSKSPVHAVETYIVELTETELQAIVTGIGSSNLYERQESAKHNGYSESVAEKASNIYRTIKFDILGGKE